MSAAPRPPYVAEPPAIYLVRPDLVVDCSVLSAKLFEESTRDEAVLLLQGRSLHAPDLLVHEIVNVALKKAKLGWPEETLALAMHDLAEQDIALHATTAAQRSSVSWRNATSSPLTTRPIFGSPPTSKPHWSRSTPSSRLRRECIWPAWPAARLLSWNYSPRGIEGPPQAALFQP